jgi:CubicO group peptidase (beta-lactamase class C family)|tara:strand:- start:631 stop:1740 length:1110 start_codon:yes stop_codon:yes gene_type:complete
MIVQGVCAPKFQELKQIFQEYFDCGKEIGANFSVVKNADVLVNIYGGLKNKNQLWGENTIVNTFSLSKGIYASCISQLIELGEIDVDQNVSFYWPEFKQNKKHIKVKHILSHQSGLYRFKEKLINKDLLDFEKIIKILENQEPDHAPGVKTYYHAKTHGYLVENLIRKITKLSLKKFFKKYISKKYNLNFNFGFEKIDFDNVSDLIESYKKNRNEITEFTAFNNPEYETNFYNSKSWRSAGVASMGGHGSALSIAKLYDLLANDLKVDNKNIISKKKFNDILKQSNFTIDESLKLPIKWTYSGFILRGGWMFGKNKESFGHNGWGGSLGFGDPIEGIGIAYVTRKINEGMGADLRAVDLIKKTYKILNS